MSSEDALNNSNVADDALFDPSLVKKKKGKKNVGFSELDKELEEAAATATATSTNSGDAPAAEAPAADAPAAEGDDDLFGGLKKKSKKKKQIPLDLDLDEAPKAKEPEADDAGAAIEGDLDFGELKKKKKSKKSAFDLEAFEKELGEGKEGEEGDEDLGDDPFKEGEGEDEVEELKETWHGTDRDYTYQELLGRVFATLRAQNPALAGDKKKYTMVPPVVQRDGSKKTMFANLADICKRMHRQPDHVIAYLFAELGTEGSVDGSQRLVIKGRFQPKQIENVLRRYIIEYVTCKTCKSPRTILTKENRIYFMRCQSCGSTRSVATIKTGFQAQTGKRSKMRAQT